jgi:hypothetical protein
MDNEITRADAKFRRRVLWWGGSLSIAGLIGLAILYRHLQGINELAGEDREAAVANAARLAVVMAWMAGLSFVGIGIWFLRLGHRVRRSRQFPPPGARVIRDTKVRTGLDARDIATVFTALGVVTAVLGAAAAWRLGGLALAALGQ